MSQEKLAVGVLTAAEMASEPLWAALVDAAGFPSGLRQRVLWPRQPDYRGTLFVPYEELVEAGDLSQQPQGAPNADWLLWTLTFAALLFTKTTFCPTGYSNTVTLQMSDSYGDLVTYYGTLWWPRPGVHMTRIPGGWADVQLRFRGLRASEAS